MKHSEQHYYVYILSNLSKTLYVGATSDLHKRVWEHQEKLVEGFTKRYNVHKLVYYEYTNDAYSAFNREKEIKKWRTEKKIALIESMNPKWKDLLDELEDK